MGNDLKVGAAMCALIAVMVAMVACSDNLERSKRCTDGGGKVSLTGGRRPYHVCTLKNGTVVDKWR